MSGCRRSAISAPLTTMRGAWSPPIASRAIVTPSLTWVPLTPVLLSASLRSCLRDLPPVIVAAGLTQVVRALQLAAIRALRIGGRLKRMMRSPHIAPRWRSFLFGNGHGGLGDLGGGCVISQKQRRRQL